jgi:hypothetical protein
MKIVEIKNITRKELPIYYRRVYKGVVVMELVNKTVEVPLGFQIEHKPTGQLDISITLEEKVDYPLVPLINELKKTVSAYDSGGKLPN